MVNGHSGAYQPAPLCYFLSDSDQKICYYSVEDNSFHAVPFTTPEADLIFNFASSVVGPDGKFYVLGGLNKYSDLVGNAVLEFSLPRGGVRILPSMHDSRYTFPSVILDNKLYVLGGRAYGVDQEALMRECEVLDLNNLGDNPLRIVNPCTWKKISSMFEKRSSHSAFVYKDHIWVLGGYTDLNQRSTLIEKYAPSTDTWHKISFRIQLGFESTHLVASGDDKVLIFGGQNTKGATPCCHELNLATGTILNKAFMALPCCMAKYTPYEKHILVFGENDQGVDTFEAFNTESSQWEYFKPENTHLNLGGFKKSTCPIPSIQVSSSQASSTIRTFSDVVCRNSAFLFGTDDEPFIVSIDKSTFQSDFVPVPLQLKLKNFQTACRISETKVFFTGGVSKDGLRATNSTFILDLVSMQVQVCPRARHRRHSSTAVLLGHYVYVMGGTLLNEPGKTVVNYVEKYNLTTNQWEEANSMNFSRAAFGAAVMGNLIFATGGAYPMDYCLVTCEVYHPERDEWRVLQTTIPMELTGTQVIYKQEAQEIVVLGGKNNVDIVDNIFTAQVVFKQPQSLQGLTGYAAQNAWVPEVTEFESKNFMVEARSHHKVFTASNNLVVLGGSPVPVRFCEVLDRSTFLHQDVPTTQLFSSLAQVLSKVNLSPNLLRPTSLVN